MSGVNRHQRTFFLLLPRRRLKQHNELLRVGASISLLLLLAFELYRAVSLYHLHNSPAGRLIFAVVVLTSGVAMMMWVLWKRREL